MDVFNGKVYSIDWFTIILILILISLTVVVNDGFQKHFLISFYILYVYEIL